MLLRMQPTKRCMVSNSLCAAAEVQIDIKRNCSMLWRGYASSSRTHLHAVEEVLLQARQEARKQAETAAQEAAAHELALMRRQLASAQSALATTEKVCDRSCCRCHYVRYCSAALPAS